MKKNNFYLYYVASIAAMTGFVANYNVSNTGAIIPYLQAHFHLSATYVGLVMSTPGIFSLLGAFVTGFLADKIGRKKTLIIATFMLIIIPILLALSVSGVDFLIYRFIISFPIAMICVVASMYLAEYAPAEKRGSIVTGYQLSVVTSILVAFTVNYFLTDLPNNWRYMSVVGSIPALIIFFLLFTIPESPVWVERFKNKINLNSSTKQDHNGQVSYADLLRKPYRKIIITGSILMAFQQLTGSIQIFAFSNYIFMASGLAIKESVFQSISIGIVNLIFTLISFIFINRFNRRTLLLSGLSFNILSLITIALFFLLHWSFGMILLIASLVSIATFAMTIGPIPWTVLNEISPSNIRAKAMSIYIIAVNIIGMINCFTFPIMQKYIGTGSAFMLYVIFCLLGIFFVLKFLPETKGKTNEELEELWEKNSNV